MSAALMIPSQDVALPVQLRPDLNHSLHSGGAGRSISEVEEKSDNKPAGYLGSDRIKSSDL